MFELHYNDNILKNTIVFLMLFKISEPNSEAIMARRLRLVEIAALFGLIKYGILPDHLELKDMLASNAMIGGATFIMQFQAFAKSKGASDLMVPAEVMIVDSIPVLGSGKLDFVGVARLVEQQFQMAA